MADFGESSTGENPCHLFLLFLDRKPTDFFSFSCFFVFSSFPSNGNQFLSSTGKGRKKMEAQIRNLKPVGSDNNHEIYRRKAKEEKVGLSLSLAPSLPPSLPFTRHLFSSDFSILLFTDHYQTLLTCVSSTRTRYSPVVTFRAQIRFRQMISISI